jgi:peptidoglycan/xylan/chitin deacetylase (PgdA/CDA1 family)
MVALMYHDVVDSERHERSGFAGADAALYKLTPVGFDAHLAALARVAPPSPMTATELLGDSRAAARSARPALLLTFDDGGASARDIAERLDRYGWRGHFFVAADRIDTPSFVTSAEIRDLHARGHVIGSHSCSHPLRMAACPPSQLLREWQRSVDILAGITGAPVRAASVPGGHYRAVVARMAAEAGLRVLFTSEPTARAREVDGCLVLGRYTVHRWTSAETVAAVAKGSRLPPLRQAVLWNAKKLTKAACGATYVRIRASLLRAALE